MKLWLLRPVTRWHAPYDTADGFVVRAPTESEARAIAQENGGDERDTDGAAWTDPELSTCVELLADGEPGVVLRDYDAG